jgi:hypothetical protein
MAHERVARSTERQATAGTDHTAARRTANGAAPVVASPPAQHRTLLHRLPSAGARQDFVRRLGERYGNRHLQRVLAPPGLRASAGGDGAGGAGREVVAGPARQVPATVPKEPGTQPADALAGEAEHAPAIVPVGGRISRGGDAASGTLLARDKDATRKDKTAEKFPWIGQIRGTPSAALRKTPAKNRADPHANTLADLSEGTFIDVIGRKGGWLHVRATVGGKEMEGYVSQELVAFNRWDIDPEAMKTGLTMREALVALKRAETRKKADARYTPSDQEQATIDAAIATVKGEPKYQVDEATYQVTFGKKTGSKIKIETINDFVLFVEAVEAQYPGASAKEVVSEIRQLWFSDVNWELLVASEGIKEAGKHVDIETVPNPIAERFDMADLAPADEGKVLATPMGNVNIGHVLAGIDARLSGFPVAYPKDHLKARGHDSRTAKFKYDILKDYSGGDPTAFATFAGDLGQAYASFIFDRYEKKDTRAKLWMSIREFAKPEELVGDLHGYIAAAVSAEMRATGSSPTGSTAVTASGIIRDLYLVDKRATGATVNDYLEKVAGQKGNELRQYIYSTSMTFAHPWYAKLVMDNSIEVGLPGDLFDDYVQEFSQRADQHELSAKPDDTLSGAVDDLLAKATAKLQ